MQWLDHCETLIQGTFFKLTYNHVTHNAHKVHALCVLMVPISQSLEREQYRVEPDQELDTKVFMCRMLKLNTST